MHSIKHNLISAKSGEPVNIVFTITDQNGLAVPVDGAEATYKIARHADEPALVTKTQTAGITLSGNIASVTFNTAELAAEGSPLRGVFFAQLKITKNGDGLIVAEGPIQIDPVIS